MYPNDYKVHQIVEYFTMLNYFADLLDELQFPNVKQEKKNQKTPVLILPLKPVL